jgi:hypothetical protein
LTEIRENIPYVIAGGVATLVAFALAAGATPIHLIVLALLIVTGGYVTARVMATDHDRRWLPAMIVTGTIVKLAGSWFRYFALFTFYGGVGDAAGYHNRGLDLADKFRALAFPGIPESNASLGTRFMGWVTGVVYTPFKPSILGGFFLFSAMALIGQVLFYAAFRRSAPRETWFKYALLIMFWPTLIYWPSSIGKEAFLMLFIGLAAYAAARIMEQYRPMWLVVFGVAVGIISVVRVHIAALLGGALFGTMLLTKVRSGVKGAAGRKAVAIVLGFVVLVPLATQVSSQFGVSLQGAVAGEGLDGVVSGLESTTGQGGSAVSGGVIRSPLDLPSGTLKVLFRPLPYEAGNLQMLIASAEGTALLLLMVGTSYRWIPYALHSRSRPYLLFAGAYTFGFIVAWSWILNLGIISRQRSLVIPFVLAVVAFGWSKEPANPHTRARPGELISTG